LVDGWMMLDELDYRIAKALREDGRLPTKHIAASLGISEPTVRSRLKKLKEMGVLQVKASLNLRKIDCAAAFLALKVKAPKMQEILKNIANLPEVDAVYQTFGEYDLIILATANDVKGIQKFGEKLAALDGVESLKSSLIIDNPVDRGGFSARVGVGVKVKCLNCRKEIKEEANLVKDEGRFFCSQTCLSEYKVKRSV
jgi:Lrp/AsnC family transcriptional regulator for asnA, asnC and gidA